MQLIEHLKRAPAVAKEPRGGGGKPRGIAALGGDHHIARDCGQAYQPQGPRPARHRPRGVYHRAPRARPQRRLKPGQLGGQRRALLPQGARRGPALGGQRKPLGLKLQRLPGPARFKICDHLSSASLVLWATL